MTSTLRTYPDDDMPVRPAAELVGMTSTLTRRAPSSVGRPVNARTVARAILTSITDRVIVTGHGTVYAGDGIAVQTTEHQLSLSGAWSAAELTAAVVEWVACSAPAVTRLGSPARYFSAWAHRDTLYLDVVDVFSSAEEDRAVRSAEARNVRAWHTGLQTYLY